ncbi:carbohydrate ABC transporter permease [Streptomyces sp. NBC_01186]|uniref:carbohydrate ABC transporter permease n=1 Tax=Streptomyces sp. NBC_01186 TaxID=2903765 RepID=UPI002E11BE20|nr:carbohydrate ABC transporter permease [Streptomyces sp. NBC_01186]
MTTPLMDPAPPPPLTADGGRAPRRRRARVGPARALGIGLIWLFVAVSLLLLMWMLLTSLRDSRAIFDRPWALPDPFKLSNYTTAFDSGFGRAALNSVLVSGSAALVSVLLAAPAAYALSRRLNRLAGPLTMLFVLGLGVPGQVLLIPVFFMLTEVNMVDTLPGLFLVYVGIAMPFTVFLLTGFFRSLPGELEESAALDGASPARTFWQIVLPLARSGLITAFILQLINNWNETLFALSLMQSNDNFTLPLVLARFIGEQQYKGADWGGMFAGLCLIVAPMLIMYAWLSRRIITGMTLGIGK